MMPTVSKPRFARRRRCAMKPLLCESCLHPAHGDNEAAEACGGRLRLVNGEPDGGTGRVAIR